MELRSPIRLYWDISPIPETPPDYERICFEIASSRALTLHITDPGDPLNPEISGIVRRLAASPLLLILTVPLSAAVEAVQLLSSGIKKLYTDVRTVEAINSACLTGISGISFRCSRSNYLLLPDIIKACMESGIAELQLPMERLNAGEEPLCLSLSERELLASRIAGVPFREHLAITANDPFIWRIVHPTLPFPDGICQAGNTMLSIGPGGDVYPCPAMPILLGNLLTSAFREIAASTIKKEVREQILEGPSSCSSCTMVDDCRGGCRGRGFHASATLDSPDPACGFD